MKPFQKITDFSTLQILGDSRRRDILRALMAAPATLTQLGEFLNMHPAKVRYHLKKLEEEKLVELTSTNIVRGFVEKYYSATSQTLLANLSLLPHTPNKESVVAMGSHDFALDLLAQTLSENQSTPEMFALPVGSLDGLMALRQGICQLAGCHLFDPLSGEYNLPYVRHIFPDWDMRLVTLASRRQGLVVAPGNPLQIRKLEDIAQEGVRFINRKKGAGTRLWLDQQLREKAIPAEMVQGYGWAVNTHLAVAQAVANGQADTGICVMAAARQKELDFIPLFEERYDLVIPEEHYQNPLLTPALETLHSGEFRNAVNALSGYDTKKAGQETIVQ
ncbi:MAG: hypothetical protein DRI56_09855 [Chloroflexota bacterium]|nr:MAG: hypothetical protein DRI56_09855 [Chloroflexota bacterium]